MMHALKSGLILTMLVFTTGILAGETKKNASLLPADYTLLDGDGVAALLADGAFWCMAPQGNTCSFTTLVTKSDGYEFAYQVASFWDEATLIHETYSSTVTADGLLCEPDRFNRKGLKVTDLAGNPVDRAQFSAVVDELSQLYHNEVYPDVCFRYATGEAANPELITQFVLDESGQLFSPLEFRVEYAPGARAAYSLRWEQ